jgi:hypothetical protein
MRDYGVEDYAVLRDMGATDRGLLGGDDRSCLQELGQYLVATDAWQRFAIWLLHKHFEPARVEVFVERAIRAPRKTEIAPIKRSAFPCNHIMTFPHELAWQYGDPSQQSGNEREIPQAPTPQGFVGYPGARCNYTNPAVAMGRTPVSVFVICETQATPSGCTTKATD